MSLVGMSVIDEISAKVTVLSFLGSVKTSSAKAIILILSSRTFLRAARAGWVNLAYLGVNLGRKLLHISLELAHATGVEGLHKDVEPAVSLVGLQRLENSLFKLRHDGVPVR